ncbi:M16 family metallopeptidase [Catenuloplanes atrovinosus]|uniref:Zn-dependent peptidase n=1 Tax=Catenuloplanes atrovinosus TaxID=137266 RepID=A0AAE3YXX6_9ACTN|nr:insulinase family protein [Catenuloplanes atrovinosus]MDR7280630.1 putative Zn-dependent peptidase [Catenuloplanes atrovinosus]
MTIKRTEIDGVPTVIAPMDGPLTAGLVFRVGRADEPLARAGITHLIEHLALHGLGLTDYHYNGSTSPVTTTFQLQGTENDVVTFLNGVCAALADLPTERLAVEKEILRTEAAGRGSLAEPLAVWRYGARGHGTIGYPEYGLTALTPDDLHAWVSRYFTRANAMLWIAGHAVPAGLALALPDGGVRMPAPEVTSALPVTPAYFHGPSARAIAYETVVARGTAAGVYSGVLERMLFRALRQEAGYSYQVAAEYAPRDGEYATVVAVADALPEKRDAALGEFTDVLTAIRHGVIDPADLAAVVTKTESDLSGVDRDARSLPGYVQNELLGRRNLSIDEFRAELRAVTPGEVARVAAEAHATSLLMIPDGRGADWAGFTAAPVASTEAVTGRRHPLLADRAQALVLGPEGVSLAGPRSVITVRYDATALLLAWPDGARRLIGHDAIMTHIEPSLFAVDPAAMAAIDAAVPADLRVDMPARDPAEIPRPPSVLRRARRRTGRALAMGANRAADAIDGIPPITRWLVSVGLFFVAIRAVAVLFSEIPKAITVPVATALLLALFLLSGWGPRVLRWARGRFAYLAR